MIYIQQIYRILAIIAGNNAKIVNIIQINTKKYKISHKKGPT